MSIPWLPSELIVTGRCIDECNAAHRGPFDRIWCGVMSHGDQVCLMDGKDLVARLERVRLDLETQQRGEEAQ